MNPFNVTNQLSLKTSSQNLSGFILFDRLKVKRPSQTHLNSFYH